MYDDVSSYEDGARPTPPSLTAAWWFRSRRPVLIAVAVATVAALIVGVIHSVSSSHSHSSPGGSAVQGGITQVQKPTPFPQNCTITPFTSSFNHTDADEVREHQALMALVTPDKATDIATTSGSWSDPKTWASGHLPGAKADVLIPGNVCVTYDTQSTVSLHTLRIDGELRFDPDKNTEMVVDTIVESPIGYWQMGTSAHPIAPTVTARVIFADNGPVTSTAWDPMQLSRGFIAHGKTEMYGATKTTFLPLAIAPHAGATTLQLAQAPVGWQAGDMVVLTGTEYRDYAPNKHGTEEARTIQSIAGTTVTLNAPLQLDHVPPASDLHVYLANYTRNIVFSSANPDTHHRGHVMFMHTDLVTLSAVEFSQLGRTDKSDYADDYGTIIKSDQHTTQGLGLNEKGRYAVHFHRAGNAKTQPAVVKDCAVVGSPGWGFVNHGSYVNMDDNAAYAVTGAAFVEEDGTGIGEMKGNIAIGGEGDHGKTNTYSPHTLTVLADMWHGGQGFALRGQAVAVEDNVASDMAGDGYAWDNWDGPANYIIPTPALAVAGIAKDSPAVQFSSVPILDFDNNVACADGAGVRMEAILSDISDSRNLIANFTGWNFGHDGGIHLRYSRVSLRNIRLIDTNDRKNPYDLHTGITLGPIVIDDRQFVLDNVNVSGFHVAVDNDEGQETGDMKHPAYTTVLDSTFANNDVTFASTDGTYLKQGTKAGLDLNKLDLIPASNQNNTLGGCECGAFTYQATIVDTLGQRPATFGDQGWEQFYSLSPDTLRAVIAQGHYTENGNTFIVVHFTVFNQLTVEAKTFYVKLYFNTAQWPTGPNLGAYGGPTSTVYQPPM